MKWCKLFSQKNPGQFCIFRHLCSFAAESPVLKKAEVVVWVGGGEVIVFSKHVGSPKPLKKMEFAQKGLKMLDQHTAQPLSSRHRLCATFILPAQAEVMPHGETQKPIYQAHVSDGGSGSPG